MRGRCHAQPGEGLCRTGHRHDLVHARADRAFEGADTLRVADRQDTLAGKAVAHGVIGYDADLTPIAPIDAECGNGLAGPEMSGKGVLEAAAGDVVGLAGIAEHGIGGREEREIVETILRHGSRQVHRTACLGLERPPKRCLIETKQAPVIKDEGRMDDAIYGAPEAACIRHGLGDGRAVEQVGAAIDRLAAGR